MAPSSCKIDSTSPQPAFYDLLAAQPHPTMNRLLLSTLTCLLLAAITALHGHAADAPKVLHNPVKGTPEIGKIDVISFAPNATLLIGDAAKSQILAIETGDTSEVSGDYQPVPGVQKKIAGMVGAPEKGVEIIDLAVNPDSRRLYIAVRKQDDRAHLILTMTPDGALEHFQIEDISHVRIPIPKGAEAPINTLTDVTWARDRIVAAARCKEEFASKIFAAEAPLRHDAAGQMYSAETYHVAHGKWETRAPMSVLIPYEEEDGSLYIVGAFSCTPVVKYPIESLQPGAKIKGISQIELGSGNRPLDMFAYDKSGDGEASVLTNTFRFHHEKRPFGPSPYWACRFDQDLLSAKETNEQAIRRLKGNDPATEKIQMAEPFHGVVQMDRLDDENALALRETDAGLELVTLALP